MILSVIYLASARRQKEEIHYNELVKYFQWQPQQDIRYFPDHIHCGGTVAEKNDQCLDCSLLFLLVHYYYYYYFIFCREKNSRKKEHRHTKGVNETNRRTYKKSGRSHHCALSEP